MPYLPDITVETLLKLGVLDQEFRVTPKAFNAAVTRASIEEQAELLGLSVIYRPARTDGSSPEEQFVRYFTGRVPYKIEGGESWSSGSEGYSIKSLLSDLVPEFDYRTRKHKHSSDQIREQVSHIGSLSEFDVVKASERSMDYFDEFIFRFEKSPAVQSPIDKAFLLKRLSRARGRLNYGRVNETGRELKEVFAEVKNSSKVKDTYVGFILYRLDLWHSLPPDTWQSLAEVTLMNWEDMYAGWPDLVFFSRTHGLTLVEVKGKDRIHSSQVFTLIKLKEILGPERVVLGVVNSAKIDRSGPYFREHTDEVIAWFNTQPDKRKPIRAGVRLRS